MEKLFQYAFVSMTWVVTPIVKRKLIDYMSLAELPAASAWPGSTSLPAATATCALLFSISGVIMIAFFSAPNPHRKYMNVIPAEGWTMLGLTAAAGAAASMCLIDLLKSGNPGLTIVYLNAATSVLTFIVGALIYGKLTWDGLAGVLLIAAGVTLTSQKS